MNSRLLLLTTLMLEAFGCAAQNKYQYSVDLTKPVNDELKINLIVPKINQASIIFYMPKIVPGTYNNSDFGKFVHQIKAFDKAGRSLTVTAMPDANSWKIKNANLLYRLEYMVEDTWDSKLKHNVYEMAGTNFEAGKNFSLNTCGIFGYLEGLKKIPFELTFTRPANFYASTGLVPVKTGANTDLFRCDNADQLYDSPIMFCVPDTTVIRVGTTNILVSVYSPRNLIRSKFVAANLQSLLNAAKNYLGGKLPVTKYAFLYYFNSEQPTVQGQGAWEHSYSSFYCLPEAPQDKFINTIIDVSSHEFFHIVTPLNMCSKEVREFNFNKTILSKHLWLYEGSTEYDAHQAQVTQGLISADEYLNRLSKKIMISKKYYNDSLPFTRLSLGSADQYADQYNNVYEKGALISACLDIYLYQLSGGNYGLKNLKHDLSIKYGSSNYFEDDALFDEISKLTFPEIRTFFSKYVEGNEMIPYETFFDMVGVRYLPKKETTGYTMGGISIVPAENGNMRINSLSKENAFGIKMGYQVDDEILAINDNAVTSSNFSDLAHQYLVSAKQGDTLGVTVKRKNTSGGFETVKLAAASEKISTTQEYVLEFEIPNEQQLQLRNAWLNTGCKK